MLIFAWCFLIWLIVPGQFFGTMGLYVIAVGHTVGICEAGSPSWRMGLFYMGNNLISQVHHPTSNLPSLSPSPVFVLHVVLECLQHYEMLPPQKSSFAELVAAAMKGPDKPQEQPWKSLSPSHSTVFSPHTL